MRYRVEICLFLFWVGLAFLAGGCVPKKGLHVAMSPEAFQRIGELTAENKRLQGDLQDCRQHDDRLKSWSKQQIEDLYQK